MRGWILVTGFLAAAAHAQSHLYLVKDINTGPDPFSESARSDFVTIGTTTLFTAWAMH